MLYVEKKDKKIRNAKWEFDTIYVDGMEGGKHREEDYANYLETKEDDYYWYKIERS